MQLAVNDIPAVILAGGQGRRMGGGKAHVMLRGVPLWRHVLDRIAPQVGTVAVNGPTHDAVRGGGAFGGVPVIADAVPDLGPLGGVLAAMVWAQSMGAARVATVAVDTPFLPRDLIARLKAEPHRIVTARTSDGVHGTTALWDVTLADALQEALQAGTRKVTVWAAHMGQGVVPFPDTTPPPFFNVNTPEDLAKAEAWV